MAPGRCSLICEPKLVLNRTQTSISWREERQARVIHAGWQISSWRSQSFMVVWYWLSAKAAGFNMFQLYYITIYSHTHAHTHMEYIYICNYYTVYNICMIKHTHIHAIRIYRYTHTHTHIYIYTYIYTIYIITVCLMFISGMLKIICDTPCHLTVSHRVIFTRMGSENGSFPSTDPMDSHNCSIFYPIEHGYELVLPWWMGNKIPSHDWGFG